MKQLLNYANSDRSSRIFNILQLKIQKDTHYAYYIEECQKELHTTYASRLHRHSLWTQMDTNGHKLVTGPAGGSQTSEMKAYGLVSIIAFDDRWCY